MSIKFNIKSPAISDIPEIIDICNEELGNEYLIFQEFEKMITDEKYFLKVAISPNSEIIGFYICLIVSKLEITELFHNIPLSQFHSSFDSTDTFGVIKTIAIKNKYKEQGIGTSLMKDCLSNFRTKNISILSLIAWKSKHGINMEGIMKNNQFIKLKEIENYWSLESIEKKYNCPDCGSPPCTCMAVIFGKFY